MAQPAFLDQKYQYSNKVPGGLAPGTSVPWMSVPWMSVTIKATYWTAFLWTIVRVPWGNVTRKTISLKTIPWKPIPRKQSSDDHFSRKRKLKDHSSQERPRIQFRINKKNPRNNIPQTSHSSDSTENLLSKKWFLGRPFLGRTSWLGYSWRTVPRETITRLCKHSSNNWPKSPVGRDLQ